MISSAWQWASKRGRVRKNEVHGEEEIKIVAEELFKVSNQETEETEQSGSFTVQDFELHATCSQTVAKDIPSHIIHTVCHGIYMHAMRYRKTCQPIPLPCVCRTMPAHSSIPVPLRQGWVTTARWWAMLPRFPGFLRRQVLVTPPLSWASSFLFKTWCKCSPKFVKFHMAMRLPNHILLTNKVDVSDGHTIFDTFICTTPICRSPWQKAWQVFGGSGPPHVVVNVYELPKFM